MTEQFEGIRDLYDKIERLQGLLAEARRVLEPFHQWHFDDHKMPGNNETQAASLLWRKLAKPEETTTPRRLPTTEELTGSDPDFTGDMTTAEYIDDIRGGP